MELVVHLEEVKEAGVGLDRELPTGAIDEVLSAPPPTGFKAERAARLVGRLSRVNEAEVVFRGGFALEVVATCNRCLDPVQLELPVEFTLDLIRKDKLEDRFRQAKDDDGEAETAGSFLPGETDEVPYTGKQVDLWPAVREQVLLAVPMGAVCREDCQGLCPVCGKNRNLEACSCDGKVPDPRWDSLRNLKL